MAKINFFVNENNCFVVPTNSPIISDKRKINYPVTKINGRSVKTRKLVYEECFGPVPEGCLISNTCSNPRCINPEHLAVITREQNTENLLKSRKKECADIMPLPNKLLTEEEKNLARVLLKTRTPEEVATIFNTTVEGLKIDLTSPF